MTVETFNIAKDLVDSKNRVLKFILENQKAIKTLNKLKNEHSHFTIWDGQYCYYNPKIMADLLTQQNLEFSKELEKIEDELANL